MKFALASDQIRRLWPPGGWRYREPATEWEITNGMDHNFDETVKLIQLHRKANPGYGLPWDTASVEEALMEQTAKRIISDTPEHVAKWVVPLDEEAKKKSPQPDPSSPSNKGQPGARLVGVAEKIFTRIRGIANGIATLKDWIGDGAIPVAPPVAQRRAMVCASCPLNQEGSGIVDAVADAIRSQTIIKNSLGLTTDVEDKLKTCSACGCNLRLKVWVPIDTIKAHMTQEVEDDLNPTCWIRFESNRVTMNGKSSPVFDRTITIQRKAAYGDVILSTLVAQKLNEVGVGVRFATEPIIARAIAGHPNIQEFVEVGKPDLMLDGAYESNIERTKKDIGLLLLEAAQQDLKRHGIQLKDFANRVPTLSLTYEERFKALETLQRLPRPWIVVIDGSGSWPNRQWDKGEVEKLPRCLEGTLIWGKNWQMVRPPPGYAGYQIANFRHLMAVVSHCDLVISTDTGPIHAAAAFNRPVIVLEQCNDTHLRLTNLTDWTAVPANLSCVRCGEMTCPIDAKKPPCQKIEVSAVAAAAMGKLDAYRNGRVSAIVPVYRWRDGVRKCVDSVVGQVDEVFMSCDGDQSPVSLPYQKVQWVPSSGTRLGYGKTNMRAARLTGSEFILFLNDDCYLDKGAVAKMMEAMTDGVGVVGCKLRYPDGLIQHAGTFRRQDDIGFGHIDHRQPDGRFKTVTEMEAVTFAAALVRRSAFFEVRGFDERYDCYWEDADVCMKMRESGWRVMYQPAATGIHDESQSTSELKNSMLAQGAQIFASKWRKQLLTSKPIH